MIYLHQQNLLKLEARMILTLSELAVHAGHEMGSRLRGRELGRIFHRTLRDYITNVNSNNIIQLSLKDAIMMDVSFIDEVFGGVAEARGRGQFEGAAMLLIHVDSLDMDDIARILEGRSGYSTGLRNCVLPVYVDNDITLIGKTEDYVAETFEYLKRNGSANTAELASDLGLALNTASTRLKTLYDLGLVLRNHQEIGRGYIYSMLTIE